jgi:hypothetical protein
MSTFWNFEELDQLHIELTNACNAACPMCVRFHNASPYTRADLTIQQITIEKFKEWFPPDVVKKCKLILFCGVHGDPCAAKDFLEICEYIESVSDITRVEFNSNAGLRRPDWWSKVGEVFARNKHKGWTAIFSIDGLRKTNHIYRRNVVWEQLEQNVRAFTKHGGISYWDFLVFKHNEHEISKARKTSKKWGITYFVPKKALGVDNGKSLKAMPALNKEGKVDYWIHAPENSEYRNLENPQGEEEFISWPFDVEEYKQQKKYKIKKPSWKNKVDRFYENIENYTIDEENNSCSINCKSQNIRNDQSIKKEVFVDCSGVVMPCCYMATHLNSTYSSPETLQLHNHMNNYGWEHFDLHKHTLKEILSNSHLNKVFADTWEKDSIANGKTLFCSMTCGKISNIDKIFTHESVQGNRRKSKFCEKAKKDNK